MNTLLALATLGQMTQMTLLCVWWNPSWPSNVGNCSDSFANNFCQFVLDWPKKPGQAKPLYMLQAFLKKKTLPMYMDLDKQFHETYFNTK
jgi:hypothetical protein